MGANNSLHQIQTTVKPPQNYTSQYVELHKEEHPLLGAITHVQSISSSSPTPNTSDLQLHQTSSNSTTCNNMFVKLYCFGNEEQFKNNSKKFKRRKQISDKYEYRTIKDPYLHTNCSSNDRQGAEKSKKQKKRHGVLKLNKIIQHQVNQFCGINYYLYCLFEEYQCVLTEDMADRMASIKRHPGVNNNCNFDRRNSINRNNITLGGNSRVTMAKKNKNNIDNNPYTQQQQQQKKNSSSSYSSQNLIYKQTQIIQLLKNITNGLQVLYDNEMRNYFISRYSILKVPCNRLENSTDSQQYVYKVLDTTILKTTMHPYQLLLINSPIPKYTYISPQLMQQLQNKVEQPDYTPKSQIFSLGMLVLQLCLLSSSNGSEILSNGMYPYYDYTNYQIDLKGIRQLLNNQQRQWRYSNILKQTILSMLEQEQQERIGLLTLKQLLQKQQNNNHNTSSQTFITGNNIATNNSMLTVHNNNPITTGNNKIGNRDNKKGSNNVIMDDSRTTVVGRNKSYSFNIENGNKIGDEKVQKDRILSIDESSNSFNKNNWVNNSLNNFQKQPSFNPIMTNIHTNSHNRLLKIDTDITDLVNVNKKQPINTYFHTKKPETTYQYHHNPSQQPKYGGINVDDQIFQPPNTPNTPINSLNNVVDQDATYHQPEYTSYDQKYKITSYGHQKNQYFSPSTNKNNQFAIFQPKSQDQTPIRKIQQLQEYQFNQKKNNQNAIAEFSNHFNHPMMKKQRKGQGITVKTSNNPVAYKAHTTINTILGNDNNTYGKHYFSNGALYEGEFDYNGNIHGNGVLYYPTKKICYSGTWNTNAFHGFGTLYNQHPVNNTTSWTSQTNYKDFSLNSSQLWSHYQGEFQRDKKNGFGTLYMCNGDKFSGCFVNDVIEGYGTFTANKTGKKVSGLWKDNILKL